MEITLRPATRDDLDTIIWIVLAAMPLDPRWLYRFPHAEQYPTEHEKYERLRYLNYFERINDGACSIMLAEISEKKSPGGRKPVAVGIWQLPGSHIPGHPSSKICKCLPIPDFLK